MMPGYFNGQIINFFNLKFYLKVNVKINIDNKKFIVNLGQFNLH